MGSFTITMFLVGWRHSRDATPTKALTTLRLFGSSQLERLEGERACVKRIHSCRMCKCTALNTIEQSRLSPGAFSPRQNTRGLQNITAD